MKICNKYITECAWSIVAPNRLAISSMNDDIQLFTTFTIDNDTGNDIARNDGKLIGHKHAVNMVKWSTHTKNRLVSCGIDCSVRVWNTDTFECISMYMYNNRMHCAIFSPNDENIIFASGINETLHAFDVRKHLYDPEMDKSKNQCDSLAIDFKYAVEIVISSNKDKQKERKKHRKRLSIAENVTAAITQTDDPSNHTDEMLSAAFKSVSLTPIQVFLVKLQNKFN